MLKGPFTKQPNSNTTEGEGQGNHCFMQTMTVALSAPLPSRIASATVTPSAPFGPVLPAATAPMLTLAGGGSARLGIAGCIASKVLAAFVPRKFNRVTCIPLILAENPVHLVAEVVQRVASQMDDAIPTTACFAQKPRSRATRHPLEHYDPARGKRILQFVGQELQLCLDIREPCDSRLRS